MVLHILGVLALIYPLVCVEPGLPGEPMLDTPFGGVGRALSVTKTEKCATIHGVVISSTDLVGLFFAVLVAHIAPVSIYNFAFLVSWNNGAL